MKADSVFLRVEGEKGVTTEAVKREVGWMRRGIKKGEGSNKFGLFPYLEVTKPRGLPEV